MKKLISGISLMFFCIILFGIIYFPCSDYMVKLGAWNTPPGKLMTTLLETGGLMPFIIAVCLFILFCLFGRHLKINISIQGIA